MYHWKFVSENMQLCLNVLVQLDLQRRYLKGQFLIVFHFPLTRWNFVLIS
jgi:hypothetical protein